jgi:phosphoglycerol geranylgeranyltransferase
MATEYLYQDIIKKVSLGEKMIAVLIDPDKQKPSELYNLLIEKINSFADLIFIGGSLLTTSHFHDTVAVIKSFSKLPLVIFPGSTSQIDAKADAILLLSLISGRNPEFLIGQQVLAAPHLKKSGLEILSTGYILIDGGQPTTVSYISNTTPIPSNKPEIAACTALAGEQLGMKLIYIDGGSGAESVIAPSTIKAVKSEISLPLIVGGGIKTAQSARQAFSSGADIIVIGTAFENDSSLIEEISKAKLSFPSVSD